MRNLDREIEALTTELAEVKAELADYFQHLDRKRDGYARDELDLFLRERKLRGRVGARLISTRSASYSGDKIIV